MREGHPITVLTQAGEIIPLNQGNTALDFAATISEDLMLKAEYVIINDDPKPQPMNTVLHHNDTVKIVSRDRWTVDIITLQSVHSESARRVAKNKIKKILDESDKYCNHIRSRVSEEGFESLSDMVFKMNIDLDGVNEHIDHEILEILLEPIPESMRKSGFKTLMELELHAEKIRRNAANLGQEILIDLNRGFRRMNKDFRKKYKIYGRSIGGRQFQKFLVDCAMGEVNPAVMDKYIEALFNYEEDLPRKLILLPNKPGVLRSFVDIAPLFANIVDIKQLANLPNVHDDRVGLELRYETESKAEEEMLSEIWDTIEKIIQNPSLIRNIIDKSYKLRVSKNESLIPFLALLERFEHTAENISNVNTDGGVRNIRIIPRESNGGDRKLTQDQLFTFFHFLRSSILEE